MRLVAWRFKVYAATVAALAELVWAGAQNQYGTGWMAARNLEAELIDECRVTHNGYCPPGNPARI